MRPPWSGTGRPSSEPLVETPEVADVGDGLQQAKKLQHVAPGQRLAAGHAQLGHAQRRADPHEARDFLVAQDVRRAAAIPASSCGMQYRQRSLQRSVIDTRR